jgi:hypothetical protein
MKYKNIQFLIIIFLGMFLFGSFVQGLTKMKYIALYGAILFYLIDIVKNKTFLYKQCFLENKVLFISLFLFLFSIILSIIFSFSDSMGSIKEFEVEFLNTSIFVVIALNIKDKKLMMKILFYMIILAFIYDTVRYAYMYIKNNPNFNLSLRLSRNYSDYFLTIYPFILSSFFIFRNKLKYIILVLLAIGFIELILTGARGAWVGVIGETVIFIFFLGYLKKEYIKRIIISVGIISVILVGSGYYIYQHSSLLKYKLHQGVSPNGRDVIVKTRLPIFLKHGNLFVGIGGPGNYQYDKFFNFYHAPGNFAVKEGNNLRYFSDEPFLLQIFYKEGVIGIITFLIFVLIFLYKGYKSLNLYTLSISTSFIGYYLIRGLVEGRELKFLLIYFGLFLIAKAKNENSIHLS